jgi:glycerol dehydrogenase
MSSQKPFKPEEIFSAKVSKGNIVPRVLNSPRKYIQSEGALDNLGAYLSLMDSTHAAVIITQGSSKRFGQRVSESLKRSDVNETLVIFGGESSLEEYERIADLLRRQDVPIDTIVAIGGGKCLDTGRAVSHRLSLPVVISPTIASTDAPCAAISVIYSQEGVFRDIELYPFNPTLVIVDTKIAAEAPFRFIVSGLGDAMATWYEARTCFQNPKGRSLLGTRPTMAAVAIAELCADTLYEYAPKAIEAVKKDEVNDAVERVVEANILLSGLGFESCGVAAAHAIGQSLTVMPEIHKNYMHGEMVAFGLVAHLILEDKMDEAEKVTTFFANVGLPVHLRQFGLDPGRDMDIIKKFPPAALDITPIYNEPFEITEELILDTILKAHEYGLKITESVGDAAYREIHG